MKKIMLSLMVIALSLSAFDDYDQGSNPQYRISISCNPKVSNMLLGIGSCALATWFLGQTLHDLGHEYAQCKKAAMLYSTRLNHDFPGVLNPTEQAIWSTMQGISQIPTVFWQEIISSTATVALYVYGIKSLKAALTE